jgi:hypothetical protein
MLGRTAIHPELGTVTLAQLLACWVTHDHAHIAQIARVLTRGYGAFVGPWRRYFSLLRDEVITVPTNAGPPALAAPRRSGGRAARLP